MIHSNTAVYAAYGRLRRQRPFTPPTAVYAAFTLNLRGTYGRCRGGGVCYAAKQRRANNPFDSPV
ncbi:MAG: hypothetical protein KF770_02345 [Anaerolineae bacterium]|nr:hypothetical protein [Anaerolineae bacterium]